MNCELPQEDELCEPPSFPELGQSYVRFEGSTPVVVRAEKHVQRTFYRRALNNQQQLGPIIRMRLTTHTLELGSPTHCDKKGNQYYPFDPRMAGKPIWRNH